MARRDRLLKAFAEAATQTQRARMQRLYKELVHIGEFLRTLDDLREDEPAPASSTRRFVVSSLFLEQCFRALTADDNEQFFFITGADVDGVHVLDQKIDFAHQRRTRLGVTGEPSATHELLMKLERFGHRLLAHFHSHPGVGLASTHPSGTDERFQRRLESAGYSTVAAIFSRDGYVRFFRLEDTFDLQIHGTGVEDLGQHTYRLTTFHQGDGEGDSRRA